MVEIVNLRQARKRKERDERARAAEENRAKFGRTEADKKLTLREKTREDRRLEGHKRAHDDDPDA